MKATLTIVLALQLGQDVAADRQCGGGVCTIPRGQQARQRLPPLPAARQAQFQGLLAAKAQDSAATSSSTLEAAKVPLAFLGWYLMSIVYSLMNKEVLTVWKFPCVFSAVQLLVGALWIGALWMPLPTFGMSNRRFAAIREPPRLTMQQFGHVSTVAVWLALGHVLSTVAPAYGTVAFTNVVKTLEPLFTCLFSALFLKQVFALPVYLSLVPVIVGTPLLPVERPRSCRSHRTHVCEWHDPTVPALDRKSVRVGKRVYISV